MFSAAFQGIDSLIKKLNNTYSRIHFRGKRSNQIWRGGGGVALYIRENLFYTIRNDLVPVQLEMICVEILSSWHMVQTAQCNH